MNYVVLEETFKDNFNEFLRDYGIYLAIALVAAIIFVILIIIFNKKK